MGGLRVAAQVVVGAGLWAEPHLWVVDGIPLLLRRCPLRVFSLRCLGAEPSAGMALIGNCMDCGSSELHARGRCSPCYWKAKRESAKATCPGCGQSRLLRPEAGRCGMCVRRARPRKQPTPRICTGCGRLAEHGGVGLCSACYQRDLGRILTWTIGALGRGTTAPPWSRPASPTWRSWPRISPAQASPTGPPSAVRTSKPS